MLMRLSGCIYPGEGHRLICRDRAQSGLRPHTTARHRGRYNWLTMQRSCVACNSSYIGVMLNVSQNRRGLLSTYGAFLAMRGGSGFRLVNRGALLAVDEVVGATWVDDGR